MPSDRDESLDRTVAAVAPPNPFTKGAVFAGRYVVREMIGRGGMGSVYRVHDRDVGETIALKVLDPRVQDQEAVERFRREVRLARRVTHRNAARTYDLGEHDGMRYLTMEYVSGESLRAIIAEQGRLTVERAAAIALQMSHGLAAAHEAEVVHRDLKPANVLVERSGRAVITDFGIARALVGGDTTLQTVGTIGTPAYMAPEQVADGEVDGRTDLYALGLILYEMLTGEMAFQGDTPIALAVARMQQDPPDPRDRMPSIPEALAKLVLACLSRDKAARPESAVDVARQLLPFVPVSEESSGPWDIAAAPGAAAGPGPSTGTRRSATVTPRTSSGLSRLTAAETKTLAVLPFRYRGPEDESYLAESLAEELVDLLSMTRGLRVSGLSATARYGERQDPREVGADLGVDAIVEGALQRSGPRVRISARLIEVETGFQLWSERFDGAMEDVFELQDRMGKRIAEALRLELQSITHRGNVPGEAVELYLRGRQRLGELRFVGPEGAVDLIERCLEIAPDFAPAMAAHAMACVRTWFVPGRDPSRNWKQQSIKSVTRAIEGAPELADTHLAAAMLAVQVGDFVETARELSRTLQIAPTYAAAHEYLGRLQMEAGRGEEGARRLRLALDLDPALTTCHLDIARQHVYDGDMDAYERVLAVVKKAEADDHPAILSLETRVAGWCNDTDRLRDCVSRNASAPDTQPKIFIDLQGRTLLGELTAAELDERLAPYMEQMNPRFYAMSQQLAAEIFALRGDAKRALQHISDAANGVLVDIEWFDRCPALASLRDDPSFAEARRKVRQRAEAITRIG